MMVSESLIEHGTVRLDPYSVEKLEPFSKPGVISTGYPYQLEAVEDRLYYHYPHGTSILSAPFVAILNMFGISTANEDGWDMIPT